MTEVFDYDKDKVYLVAVSGGPDSMALLDMLYKQKYKIMVAHVNYKKRVESDEEQQMVQHYCETKKIPFYSTDFDSKKVDLKQSFQVQAREFRYHFFSEIYQEKQCDGLFVAHQKDDLIETYLLKKQRNVINESYLILNETIIKKMKVYRPLLNDYKNELLDYCLKNQVPYRIDKSNFSFIYPRNVIRNQLLNEDKEKIFNQAINDEKKLKEKQIEVKEYLKTTNVYLLTELDKKDDLFLQIFLHHVVDTSYQKWINKNILSKLKSFFKSEKPNLKHKIEKNYYMIKAYNVVLFKELEEENSYCYQLSEFKLLTTPYFKTESQGYKMQGIYLSTEDFPIKIRSYKKDDIIELSNGKKKITRLFIDKKIPLDERWKIPVIENKDGKILFVSGIYRYFKLKLTQNNFFVVEYKTR